MRIVYTYPALTSYAYPGPPVARNGPKDTDLTPVVPRYYSPGLPEWRLNREDIEMAHFQRDDRRYIPRGISIMGYYHHDLDQCES
jgi:hypothetical protein